VGKKVSNMHIYSSGQREREEMVVNFQQFESNSALDRLPHCNQLVSHFWQHERNPDFGKCKCSSLLLLREPVIDWKARGPIWTPCSSSYFPFDDIVFYKRIKHALQIETTPISVMSACEQNLKYLRRTTNKIH
jgi:hypothetical protein